MLLIGARLEKRELSLSLRRMARQERQLQAEIRASQQHSASVRRQQQEQLVEDSHTVSISNRMQESSLSVDASLPSVSLSSSSMDMLSPARARMARLTRQMEADQQAADLHADALQERLTFLQSQMAAKRLAMDALPGASSPLRQASPPTLPSVPEQNQQQQQPVTPRRSSPLNLDADDVNSATISPAELQQLLNQPTSPVSASASGIPTFPTSAAADADLVDLLSALDSSPAVQSAISSDPRPVLAWLVDQVVQWQRRKVLASRQAGDALQQLEAARRELLAAQQKIDAVRLEADRRLLELQRQHERDKRSWMLPAHEHDGSAGADDEPTVNALGKTSSSQNGEDEIFDVHYVSSTSFASASSSSSSSASHHHSARSARSARHHFVPLPHHSSQRRSGGSNSGSNTNGSVGSVMNMDSLMAAVSQPSSTSGQSHSRRNSEVIIIIHETCC